MKSITFVSNRQEAIKWKTEGKAKHTLLYKVDINIAEKKKLQNYK